MKLFPFSTITDEQAMWRVQMDSDPEAFTLLVRRWEVPIQNLCSRMLGDVHRAQDLAQEAFSRVFARRKDWVPAGKFSTFLWRISLNLCYDELRRRTRRRETELMEDDPAAEIVTCEPGPDRELENRETADEVRQALLQLSDVYRSVLVLRHYEGLKFREIADVLGLPEGTVKSRMAEGLTQLGRLLERRRHSGERLPAAHPPKSMELTIL